MKRHRRGQLPAQQGSTAGRVGRVGHGRDIGVNRDRGRGEGCFCNNLGKRFAGRCHQWAVKGGGNGQVHGAVLGFSTDPPGAFKGLIGSGEHTLVGAVDVGQHQIRYFPGQGLQVRDGGLHGQHPSRVAVFSGIRHQAATRDTQAPEGFPIDPTRGTQGRQLPVTVSAGCIRPYLEIVQNRKHAKADGADGKLRHLGPAKVLGLPAQLVFREARLRIKVVPQGCGRVKMVSGTFNGLHEIGKTAGQVSTHMGILAPLSGKQECRLARFPGCRAVIDPLSGP